MTHMDQPLTAPRVLQAALCMAKASGAPLWNAGRLRHVRGYGGAVNVQRPPSGYVCTRCRCRGDMIKSWLTGLYFPVSTGRREMPRLGDRALVRMELLAPGFRFSLRGELHLSDGGYCSGCHVGSSPYTHTKIMTSELECAVYSRYCVGH